MLLNKENLLLNKQKTLNFVNLPKIEENPKEKMLQNVLLYLTEKLFKKNFCSKSLQFVQKQNLALLNKSLNFWTNLCAFEQRKFASEQTKNLKLGQINKIE